MNQTLIIILAMYIFLSMLTLLLYPLVNMDRFYSKRLYKGDIIMAIVFPINALIILLAYFSILGLSVILQNKTLKIIWKWLRSDIRK
jgi:hypothetical protein